MSFELAAQINKREAEGFRDEALRWKEIAEQLRKKGIDLAAAVTAERALRNEIISELAGNKAKRLSDVKNREARNQFYFDQKRLSQRKFIEEKIHPLNINEDPGQAKDGNS